MLGRHLPVDRVGFVTETQLCHCSVTVQLCWVAASACGLWLDKAAKSSRRTTIHVGLVVESASPLGELDGTGMSWKEQERSRTLFHILQDRRTSGHIAVHRSFINTCQIRIQGRDCERNVELLSRKPPQIHRAPIYGYLWNHTEETGLAVNTVRQVKMP